MKHKLGSYLLASLLPVAFGVSPVFAAQLKNSEHSVTVIPAEGNGVCSDYGANDFIMELGAKISCPAGDDPDEWIRVGNPDGAHAYWRYDCYTNELEFKDSNVDINYTVTKAGRNITWYPYGSGTWNADSRITNQDANSTGDYAAVLEMASFALCYGLPASDNAVEPAAFPNCSSEENNAWLNAINCGEVADGTVVTLWQPPNPDFPNDDRLFQCVCNDNEQAVTVDCDPSGDSGDLIPCYDKVRDEGQDEATTVVEFDADPVVCTTVGGTRTCKWVKPLW